MFSKISLFVFSFLFAQMTFAQIFEQIDGIVGINQLDHTMGMAVADYDNDQDLDLFVVAKNDYAADSLSTWSRLFQNNNDGTFTDVTIEAGFNGLYDHNQADPGFKYGVKIGASWGDYDNDGFPDLFLTNYLGIQLFHNKGDGTFEEVTAEAGLPVQDSCINMTALWWDVNKDSWLDLYVTRWRGCSQNRFFLNKGDGTFEDQTATTNLGGQHAETFMAVPLDANKDGEWDLYLSNDFAKNELFIQNNDQSFTDKALDFKVDFEGNDMGMSIGDYNNDGAFDVYITNIGLNRLMTATNGNEYKDLTYSREVNFTYWGWATQFADFDLDGDEDLFVTSGYQNDVIYFTNFKDNFLFKNLLIEGEDLFEDRSAENQLKIKSNSMGLCVFDYDNDGDQDAIVSNMDAAPFFYQNNSTDNPAHWVNIHLEGTVSNRDGLGSKITLWTGDNTQHRLYNGATLLAQNLQPVHFGLGEASTIDSLEITWDSGIKEKFYELPSNAHILLKEAEELTILEQETTTPISTIEPEKSMVLYPNPTTAFNQITLTNIEPANPIKILNTNGQAVAFSIIQKTSNQITLELKDIQPGIYFIITGNSSSKLVVL